MVIKTEACYFSEFKIYPGRGHRFVRKDGRMFLFGSKKSRKLHFQGCKPSSLTWTPLWRRNHKKGALLKAKKKRTKKTTRKMKAVVGISLAEINRIRAQDTSERTKLAQKVKESKKADQKKKVDAKSKAAKGGKKPKQANMGKQQKGGKVRRSGH